MVNKSRIRPRMAVCGACGERVGVVDCVEGNTIKLIRLDAATASEPHYLPLGWVAKVDQAVRLNKRSADVLRAWDEEPSQAR